MKRISGVSEGETLAVFTHDPPLELRIEQAGDGRNVLITVYDKHELLGRILVSADDVSIWQAGDLSGQTVEWVGLGSAA